MAKHTHYPEKRNSRKIEVVYPQAFVGDRQRMMEMVRVESAILEGLTEAYRLGLVVTITNRPDAHTPLAQGNYHPHVEIYETKERGLAREKKNAVKEG